MTESDGTKYVVITGGSTGLNPSVNLETTLFLDVTDGSVIDSVWQPGPAHGAFIQAQMLTDPATGNVILIGGKDASPQPSSDPVGSMYRLESITSNWEKMEQVLESPRTLHVSFFVPDDKLPCQNKN
jgi:hypothetical protein